MDRSCILKLILFLAFFVLQPGTKSQWLPVKPLCRSQFALVNHACAFLPYVPTPSPSPPSPPSPSVPPFPPHPPSPPSPSKPPFPPHPPLPPSPILPPFPPLPPLPPHPPLPPSPILPPFPPLPPFPQPPVPPFPLPPLPPSSYPPGGRGHHRGHRENRVRYWPQGEPVESYCCKWLAEIDNQCVCDVLVHLPPFLSRPAHEYTVQVGDDCNVTYHCGSRILT